MRQLRSLAALVAVSLILGACAGPAAPSPTTAPAKPAAAQAPAKPAAAPTTAPAAAAKPAAQPAAKPATAGGTVTLYTSVPQNIANRLQEVLKRERPDLQLTVFRAGTGEVVAKLAAEQKAGAIQADVVWVAEPSTYEDFKKQNLLLKFTPEGADKLPAEVKDPEGFYYGGRLINTVIIYNTNLVKEPPKGWQDLADPRFKGGIGLPDPARSGAALAFVGALADAPAFGWQYFEKLKANGAVRVANNTQANEKVASGELALASTLDYMIRELKEKGSPVDGVWPQEGAIFTPSPVGIIASSKNPEAAKSFVNFLLSREGQQILVEVGNFIPVRPDVAPPAGAPKLEEIRAFPLNWQEIANRDQQIKDKFEGIFGG